MRLADGQPHPLLGEVSIPIKMGPFRDTVRLLVMKAGTASANIILGTDWLKRRKARMCWETDTLSLQRGGTVFLCGPTMRRDSQSHEFGHSHPVCSDVG